MSVKTATVTYGLNGDRNAVSVVWVLANGDTGSPFEAVDFNKCSVQITGTFGAGGSVRLEGSNDGTNYTVLTDPQGNALTKTSVAFEQVQEVPRYQRPNCTAGDGTTALTVTLWAARVASVGTTSGSGSGLTPVSPGTILGNASGVSALPSALTALPAAVTTAAGGSIFGSNDTQTLTNKSVDGGSNTLTNLPAAQLVGALGVSGATGTWDVANGGTGAATLSGILKGNAASPITSAAASDIVAAFSGASVDSSHYLATDGTKQALVVGSPVDIQIFTSSGTWAKPAGTPKYTRVIAIGAGGGGGGGANIASGTAMSGGGGGGSGFTVDMTFASASLGSNETVTLGTAGTAGTAGSTSAGGNGGVGGNTTFGTWATAFGGGGGQGGASGANTGGGGGAGAMSVGIVGSAGGGGAGGTVGGSTGGSNSGTAPVANLYSAGGAGDTSAGNGAAGGSSAYGPCGGGAGAGIATTPAALSGGAGGKNVGNPTAPGAGSPGAALTSNYFGGSGGGGGNSAISTNTAQTGGAGARGSGGGGGGAALTTGTSGAGGAGGGGYLVAITSF